MQEDTIAMAFSIMSARQKEKFKNNFEIDIAYSVPNLGRFRCNIFQQRGTVGLVLRVIPARILTIRDLLLPPVLEKICEEQRGLVLCTGTTGSGKSTTLAAMIDHINATRNEHIMTVEDPIEFLHRDKKSIVNQREVEVDTKGFVAWRLRSALRQDPDVILVGEMRDYETIETALTAAETGHLVFSTLHTLDATETINRIISVFPPHQQKQIRLQLGAVLKAVISLRLMPRADGLGRVPAAEILIRDDLRPRVHREQGEDQVHQGRDPAGHVAVRHADVRPVALPALQVGPDHARGGPQARRRTRTSSSSRSRASSPPPTSRARRWTPRWRRRRTSTRSRGGVALRLLEPAPGTRLDEAPQLRRPARPRVRVARLSSGPLRLLAVRARGREELETRACATRGFDRRGGRRGARRLREAGVARRPGGGALGGRGSAARATGGPAIERELTARGFSRRDGSRRPSRRRAAPRGKTRSSRRAFAKLWSAAGRACAAAAPPARVSSALDAAGFRGG